MRARLIPAEAARMVTREIFAVARAIYFDHHRRLSGSNQQLLAKVLADAAEPLADKTAQAVGATYMVLRH